MAPKTVRIGGASGYWGDTASGPRQLVERGQVDYLVLDYLAEITMSILAKARARDPDAGYAIDFITEVMRPLLPRIAEQRIKVVANAGGVNLDACRRRLQAVAAEAGVDLRIGTVQGDDLMPALRRLRDLPVRELRSGAPLPDEVASANAYLGAFPIAAALGAGADVVVTGRCVDSALTLGPLIHEFGWGPQDHDLLAAGSLAGHLLECGAQVTGGNVTDWRAVADGWEDMGFPVAEVSADGTFVVTKPPGTGGAVTPLTVSEQLVYEIGDPAAYVLPDVVCDFTQVRMEQQGKDEVRVEGARGRAPTGTYKVSATHPDGFGCIATLVVAGVQAAAKAQRTGEAILAKTRAMLRERGWGDFTRSALQTVGTESLYGASARPEAAATREVVLRVVAHHRRREAMELFSREFTGSGLCMTTGRTALVPGRPSVSSVVRLFSFLVGKDEVPVTVRVDGSEVPFERAVAAERGAGPAAAPRREPAEAVAQGPTVEVPLHRLAVARSGDKGDDANIGVVARRPELLPWIRGGLPVEAVRRRLAHFAQGPVERYELPGIHGLNFVVRDALGGGGTSSLHLDPQAKTYAQLILDLPIPVPAALAGET